MGQEMEHFAMPVTRQLTHQQSAPADDRQPMLPLIGRRDDYELTYSAPLPFLFHSAASAPTGAP